jgi:hypothetical protein
MGDALQNVITLDRMIGIWSFSSPPIPHCYKKSYPVGL